MSEPVTEESNTALSWENRLALWLPRPPLFGAFLIAVCLSAAYLSFQWFFDLRVDRGAFGVVLLIAFLLMVSRYFLDRVDRQKNGMEESLADRHQVEVQGLHMPRDAIRVSRFAGAVGIIAFVGLWQLLQVFQGQDLVTPWLRFHRLSATAALFLLLGWLTGRRTYLMYVVLRDAPGPQRSDIDLLDLKDLYALGRGGLHATLVLYVVFSICGLIILPGLGSGLWVVLPMFAFAVGLGLLILLRPAHEVRSLIRAVKREELARLEPLLRQARDDALTGDVSTQGRLTDLLAYKTQVESTPEWSFDSSTFLRFGLYLLIPVASMVGGALVERVVDFVLD
ncbi:MAG: hypothetical protein O6913_01395 [Chloroflexi bacterium]|nr:hypothetical protein [Chloroflexota bacterium]